MNFMLSKVPEIGTGRRAALPGIISAGKTGTTNAYRDAWYVGYTGNFVGAVWFGNDDYTSTNRMTGGSLPAQTWREVMEFAHQGIEIKPIPGVDPNDKPPPAANKTQPVATGAIDPQVLALSANTLSRRSFEVLGGLNQLFRAAKRPARTVPIAGPTVREGVDTVSARGLRAVGGRIAIP
jgi:penicillin-binding protein 1A